MNTLDRSVIVLLFLLLFSCAPEKKSESDTEKLFTLLPPESTGITFSNQIQETNAFNFLNYAYIYNGGGVAIADFDQDGLDDLYFSANQGSNKLYRNLGNFAFQDITDGAGVADMDGWSTGVSILDVNLDSYPDIYVSKSGEPRNATQRKNKLFINQRDGTFTEEADQWGLAHHGFSTQAYPVDYDLDGDLDLYLVNHRPDFGNTSIDPEQESDIWNVASDQLFRNDGDQFVNVTFEAGVANKAWGLSAMIGDFNEDGWPDIYVCNDFNQPDYLYINDQKGHFRDSLKSYTGHISMNSMGSDLADFNNDELPDMLVLDMSAEDHVRSKSNMPSMSTDQFFEIVHAGYHHQYMSNVLQLNQGVGFSDIAQLAHVAKTDWSWAPLFADLDQDGWKDVLVTNGIYKDLGNVDFRNTLQTKIQRKDPMSLESVLAMVPSTKLPNYAFQNNRDLTFSKISQPWGLDAPTFSNGVALGDLDNDGDLDLVLNNMEDPAFIYRNNSNGHYLQIELIGSAPNPMGLGASVALKTDSLTQRMDMNLARGFQSSVSPILSFGLASDREVDQLSIEWPDGRQQVITNIAPDQRITIRYTDAKNATEHTEPLPSLMAEIAPEDVGLTVTHQENEFDDFEKQLLLPWKMSQLGPFSATADLNGDQLEDLFLGGGSGQSSQLYIQTSTGFRLTKQKDFELDSAHEDMQAVFLDFDQDGDQDLYVVSGGNARPEGHTLYQDRLYENDGAGNFSKTTGRIPDSSVSGMVVRSSDFDQDGDPDLFVGGRHSPWKYPYPPQSKLLVNEDGIYTDQTPELAPKLAELGMITGAVFSDFDLDGDEDLMVVGEWMPITVFENQNGSFSSIEVGLKNTSGLWQTIAARDIDGDGDDDYFAGNLGLNTKYRIDETHSFHIYCDDFDQSGSFDIVLSNSYQDKLVPIRGRECSSQQVPFIKDKFETFEAFANASVVDVFGEAALASSLHYEAQMMESVFIRNDDGQLKIIPLPNELQMSPVRGFEFADLDHDQTEEIICVGNLHETEVETVRFDASYGHIMKWNTPSPDVIPVNESGFVTPENARHIEKISTSKGLLLVVTENGGCLRTFLTGQKPY